MFSWWIIFEWKKMWHKKCFLTWIDLLLLARGLGANAFGLVYAWHEVHVWDAFQCFLILFNRLLRKKLTYHVLYFLKEFQEGSHNTKLKKSNTQVVFILIFLWDQMSKMFIVLCRIGFQIFLFQNIFFSLCCLWSKCCKRNRDSTPNQLLKMSLKTFLFIKSHRTCGQMQHKVL